MKKILTYISLLVSILLLATACTQSNTQSDADQDAGTLRLSFNVDDEAQSGAYDALEHSTMRVYKVEEGKEALIRKYQPATSAPGDLYLVAGKYRIKVQAGDQSQASFTNKSYYGELEVDIAPQQIVTEKVVCATTNIGVKVVFDQTVLDKMNLGHKAYVSVADTFSKTEAESGFVPTLQYTTDGTGYYLLPANVHNLSWGFYGSGTTQGEVSKTGVITTPKGGNLHTLTFKYSKSPNGYMSLSIQMEGDTNSQIYLDDIEFVY